MKPSRELKDLRDGLRTWAEVDLDRILANFDAARQKLPASQKLLVVLKAGAYGHGALPLAKLLQNRADYFAVAFTDEALELRKSGIQTPILLLGHVPPKDYPALIRHNITVAIPAERDALLLSEAAVALHKTVNIHFAIDSGMSRIGFPCEDGTIAKLLQFSRLPGLSVEGIFSHFAMADITDKSFTLQQIQRFSALCRGLEDAGLSIPLRHLYNSAAIIDMEPAFDMAREGILLYGLHPSPEVDPKKLGNVLPAMSLRSHIVHLKTLPAGTPISYGGTYITEKETRVATVCAGYADGVPRLLSGHTSVLVRGCFARILGRICMDQFMIDCTDIPEACVGDMVTIFGEDGNCIITADELAESYGSIGYELLCGINQRVPRVYVRKTETGETTVTQVDHKLPFAEEELLPH